MKKIILSITCLIGFVLFSNNSFAQERAIASPRLSPQQKTVTKIGIVEVELTYCRPSMRGRTIFGALVPYGKIWRTGANKNTKIVFKDDVLIENKAVAAGTYTIFTKPNIDKWEIYIHTELDEYGAPESLDDKNIVAQFSIPITTLNRDIETLSIGFENFTANSAILAISWEKIFIPIKIEIPMNKLMDNKLQNATKTLASDYSAAAWNHFNITKDYEKALKAIDYSIQLTEGEKSFSEWLTTIDLDDWSLPWAYQVKSEIHAALNDKKSAIKAAKRALEIAEKVNDAPSAIKKNKANIEKWKK